MGLMPFVWLGLAVALGIVEAAGPALVCIWFCLGAVVSFVVSLFIEDLLVQVIVFLAVSLVALIALRPLIRRSAHPKGEVPTNSDALVGKLAVIEQDTTPDSDGRAIVADVSWLARSAGSYVIPAGAKARIVAVDGARLVVEPAAI